MDVTKCILLIFFSYINAYPLNFLIYGIITFGINIGEGIIAIAVRRAATPLEPGGQNHQQVAPSEEAEGVGDDGVGKRSQAAVLPQ